MPTGEPSQEFIFQYWTADIEGNTEYTGTDNVSEDTGCAVVFAAYDADGALTNIKIETTMLESGTSIVTPRGFDTEGAASVTVMLWDSLDGMMPLCSSNKVQLQ